MQAEVGDGSWLDRLYYSYVTLTALGCGDLTTATDVARMTVHLRGVLGQLHLVNVVALVVGNIGTSRRPRRSRG